MHYMQFSDKLYMMICLMRNSPPEKQDQIAGLDFQTPRFASGRCTQLPVTAVSGLVNGIIAAINSELRGVATGVAHVVPGKMKTANSSSDLTTGRQRTGN